MGKMLYDRLDERSSCGVGFITHKRSVQTHELLELANQALCKVPHRGGFNAEGVGDGGGVGFDLSPRFYRHLTGLDLAAGAFAVGNFFLPVDEKICDDVLQYLQATLDRYGIEVLHRRDVPVNNDAINAASQKAQLPIVQWVLARPAQCADWDGFEHLLNGLLLEIEEHAVNENQYPGFYPLSLSSRTQVYKGLLNSWEVIPYYDDLRHPEHEVSMLWFHTRFSTNTAPNPSFAQPFRHLAHNGELNTDRKSRISELAVASHDGYKLAFPPGQSDSARLDQTLTRRLWEDRQPIDEIMVKMMPPAWENKQDAYPLPVRDMLAYFSLSEEKNDGPAGLVFCDGVKIGAALDRLGLRPLRTVETEDYIAAMSEAGQIDFPPETIISRGRIKAGGMFVFDHSEQVLHSEEDILERMAAEQPYGQMLNAARIRLNTLPDVPLQDVEDRSPLDYTSRHIAYGLNQESFRFLLDPMLENGAERVSAMGYGLAINAVTGIEGGMSRFFTQRFAQVTNPPLDSIRETEGMTLRVTLGGKPHFVDRDTKQLVMDSPLLLPNQLATIEQAGADGTLRVGKIEALYDFHADPEANEAAIEAGITAVCERIWTLCKSITDIIILDDSAVSRTRAALPAPLLMAAVNRYLIENGFRFHTSIVYHTGQIASTHDAALILGLGASAVCPATVYNRARELYAEADVPKAMYAFKKALHKALLKTMGKFGLCTVESYSGGAFFEPAFLDTKDPRLAPYFPNSHAPIGGVGFSDICYSAWQWHDSAIKHHKGEDVPLLGLFKERGDGAGHSYGHVAVKTFGEMTTEAISFAETTSPEGERLHILPQDDSYLFQSHQPRTPEQIDAHQITPAYHAFIEAMDEERRERPSALRDILGFPADVRRADSQAAFTAALATFKTDASVHSAVRGLDVSRDGERFVLRLDDAGEARHKALAAALQDTLDAVEIIAADADSVQLSAGNQETAAFLATLCRAPDSIALDAVQPAHEITAVFTGGAMSHGSLLFKAHQAVAIGANMVGAKSNSGEGGEHPSRYNTIRASKIKQIASGRFGVWAGYLADPMLEELEIKIGQGAKPGEGGQLPAKKVTVEIASMRGGTPGVELVSPPPHHDTYSIEDLGQLIHDCKAARVKVIVKLVSSEGIGTIAVGVAKAGADIINVAGNTGGTGAAQVTSLKHSGRIAELGLAEVHQALTVNGLRDKVELRCSGAHQTGSDIIKSAMLGGDSFEFGTTALMMLKCVMAKNCNIKCPVGLTTPHEVFDGDPRALAQYFMNVAHDVRRLLAELGFTSLQAIRGRADLLHLINHPNLIGRYRMDGMLQHVQFNLGKPAVALEADFAYDDAVLEQFNQAFPEMAEDDYLAIDVDRLTNINKTAGGQFGIDVERYLNYQFTDPHPKVITLTDGRRVLDDNSVEISSHNSAGQSFGAFNNSGITLIHRGTCNDGAGKSMSGGRIIVQHPGGGSSGAGHNVLLGNFALFGATGGELYAAGEAGDRFAVRNSGAVAVVEGVGDFGCEYMTNGAVVNLGSYGRGFGNGMSGGIAYQYDPDGTIVDTCAQDSVKAIAMDSDDPALSGQADILYDYLARHYAYTGSAIAERLLARDNPLADFYCLIPQAWLAAHDGNAVLAATPRAEMINELAAGIRDKLLRDMQHHYRQGSYLFGGALPGEGNTKAADYIVAAGVLFRAQAEARARGVTDIDHAAKKLILNDDRSLSDTLLRDVMRALGAYSDEGLAALLAGQRVDDYCRALAMRANFDCRALGTYAWILHRQRANRQAQQQHQPLNDVLSAAFAGVMAEAMYQQDHSAA